MNNFYGRSAANPDPTSIRLEQEKRREQALRESLKFTQEEVSVLARIVQSSKQKYDHYTKLDGLAEIAETHKIPLDTLCRCHVYFSQQLKDIHHLALMAINDCGDQGLIARFKEELEELNNGRGSTNDRGTDSSGAEQN